MGGVVWGAAVTAVGAQPASTTDMNIDTRAIRFTAAPGTWPSVPRGMSGTPDFSPSQIQSPYDSNLTGPEGSEGLGFALLPRATRWCALMASGQSWLRGHLESEL